MGPSQVELLQVVVTVLEFAPIKRINAAIVNRCYSPKPSAPLPLRRMRCPVRRNVVASVYANRIDHLSFSFMGRIDASLGVAVIGEHLASECTSSCPEPVFDVRRNISPDFYDHSRANGWDVNESIHLYRIESIQIVMVQKLAAEPSLGIHEGFTDNPCHTSE